MTERIRFTLDGSEVEARAGETIWQVARRYDCAIPQLCYAPQPGYRADGNCRVCMVEIEGERVLAASCLRKPVEGMRVDSTNQRVKAAQRLVMELLLADQPERQGSPDQNARLWRWADDLGVSTSRFPGRVRPQPDASHPAMRVALDACIHCNLCVRACREVQANDVIGMAYRGHHSKIVFDFDDRMGHSSCVACGECVQACPTGALREATRVDGHGAGTSGPFKEVASVCPYCGVGCQLTYQLKDKAIVAVQGRNGPSNENRLCVKGRFGFDYISHSHRLTQPLLRRDDAPKSGECEVDPANPWSHFRQAGWEEALQTAAGGLKAIRDRDGGAARADWWIIQQIARRLDCDWDYTHPRDVFAEMARLMPSLSNISWERLDAEGSVTYPCQSAQEAGEDIVFGDAFPTPSGRGKLVPATLIPPDELPDAAFPMVLTTGRQLEHWHTGAMSRRATVLDELEPEAVASLSPQDLSSLGIRPGSKIRVSTRRGVIELSARADTAVPQGMIFIPFCYAEAPANVLTNQALDPFGKIPEFKFCAARVDALETNTKA